MIEVAIVAGFGYVLYQLLLGMPLHPAAVDARIFKPIDYQSVREQEYQLEEKNGDNLSIYKDQATAKALITTMLDRSDFITACSYNKIRESPSTDVVFPISTRAYWSAQPLTPDSSATKIEIAGNYTEIGYLLGQWYREQGHFPRGRHSIHQTSSFLSPSHFTILGSR